MEFWVFGIGYFHFCEKLRNQIWFFFFFFMYTWRFAHPDPPSLVQWSSRITAISPFFFFFEDIKKKKKKSNEFYPHCKWYPPNWWLPSCSYFLHSLDSSQLFRCIQANIVHLEGLSQHWFPKLHLNEEKLS